MSTLRMLFVDDLAPQRDRLVTAVEDWNKGHPDKNFDVLVLGNSAEATKALRESRFDCALFDLRLKEEPEEDDFSGNKLGWAALTEVGVPVGIISGHPDDVDDELMSKSLVQTFTKQAGAFKAAVEWLGSLWDMMEVLAVARRKIRSSSAEIFAGRVWPRWDAYRHLNLTVGELEHVVTRQYAGHIAELLGIDGLANPDWHPVEAYIRPAFQDDRAYTGDIFDLAGELWVVLTPPCDMAAGVQTVLLAQCRQDIPDWEGKVSQLKEILAAGGAVTQKVKDYFQKLVQQNIEPSKHFLPPLDGRPMKVDFKQLTVRMRPDLMGQLENRKASIAAPFLTNLTQRFGAYISRTGQPNIEITHFAHGDQPAGVAPAEA